MNRMQSIGTVAYATGWISIVLGLVYRALLYSGIGAHFAIATNVAPRNLLQLSLLAFVIAIASDTRCAAHSSKSDEH
jgi:hypothetical protein